MKKDRIKLELITLNDHIRMNIDDAQKSHSKKTCAIFTNDDFKPEQVGSGVFFKTENKYFIITASHVLQRIGFVALMIRTKLSH